MGEPKNVPIDRGWRLILKDLGIDAVQVLRGAGLPEDLFQNDGAQLPIEQYFRFWNEVDKRAANPSFPILLGESISVEAFHPMIFAALCSPNFQTAAERIARYKRLIFPMTMTATVEAEGLVLRKRWNNPAVPPSLAATELVLLTQIARIGTRERIEPLRVVGLQRFEPNSDFAAYFGVPPTAGNDPRIVFRPEDAQMPFVTASERLWKTFEPELQRRLAELDTKASARERLHAVLLEGLPAGEVSIDAAAARLGITPRTLQRRLRREGETFKGVVQATRTRLAQHYLQNTNLAYAEISFLLGFEEPSSFFRAYRSWTGQTPGALRQHAEPPADRPQH